MAPAIMRDAAITARSEKEHLVLERICGERPAVAEDYRLPPTPVVVVNLRAVLSSDRTHVKTPSRVERKERPAKRKGTFCGRSLNLSPRSSPALTGAAVKNRDGAYRLQGKPLRQGERGRKFGMPPGIVPCPAIGPKRLSIK